MILNELKEQIDNIIETDPANGELSIFSDDITGISVDIELTQTSYLGHDYIFAEIS